MIVRILGAFAASLWFSFVFLIALILTFPTGAAMERARWEVQDATDGSMALELDSLSPWWTGAKATNITLYNIDKRKQERGDEDAATVLFSAEHARARVGLLSLITGQPYIAGTVGYGAGELDVEALIRENDKGAQRLGDLTIAASDFPISSLPPMGGVSIDGTGELDMDVELDATDGMRKANGAARLFGEGLQITKITAPDNPMLEGFDMVVEITELDLVFEIREGRAKVKRGTVGSNLFNTELSGEIILMEDLTRTRLRLKAVVELGDDLAMFKSFLKDAKHKDNKYHYRINGTLGAPRMLADRDRAGSASNNRNRNRNRNARDKDDGGNGAAKPISRSPNIKGATADDRGVARTGRSLPKVPINRTFVEGDDEGDTDDGAEGGDDTDEPDNGSDD